MAQSESVLVTAPAGTLTAVRPERTRISLRTWGPRVAMLLAMVAGVLMANLLPAIISNGRGQRLGDDACLARRSHRSHFSLCLPTGRAIHSDRDNIARQPRDPGAAV